MRKILAAALILAIGAASAAQAQVQRIGPQEAPISTAVAVPAGADRLLIGGVTPSPVRPGVPNVVPPQFGDTNAQMLSILDRVGEILQAQGYGFGDVVVLRVYLVGDRAKGGLMDMAGMMQAYARYFGTPAQPGKPILVTVQVAAMASAGVLAQIDAEAVRVRR